MPGRHSSKPFLSINLGRVALPLPLPPPQPGQPFVCGKVPPPLEMLKSGGCFDVSAYRAPKDTSRPLHGPQGPLRDLPGPPQGPPKRPPRPQKDPQCRPKNLQMLKTHQTTIVFQCFHKPPNVSIRATQAPPRTFKGLPWNPPRPQGSPRIPQRGSKEPQAPLELF